MTFLQDLCGNLCLYPLVTVFFLLWPVIGSILFVCFEYECRFKDREKRQNAIYLAVTTYTSTGSGRVTPQTRSGEWVAVANGIMGILALAYFIAIFVESL